MEENNNNNESKVVEAAKQGTKNLIGKGLKKILPTILPYIGGFFLILLAVGFIIAVPLLIKNAFASLLGIFSKDKSNAQNMSTIYESSIIGAAQQVHDEEMTWEYSLDSAKLPSPVSKALVNPHKSTCCATYVSCVLYASGYFSEEEISESSKTYSFHSAKGVDYLLNNSPDWIKIDNKEDFIAGDVVVCDENTGDGAIDHVQIYAGDGKWFNAGNTDDIQNPAPKQGEENWDAGYASVWAHRATGEPKYEPAERLLLDGQIISIAKDGSYKLKVKDLSKKILEELENQKINNEVLGFDTKELGDMIDKYIEAEVQTTYPETKHRKNDVDGKIIIKRASTETEKVEPLEYVDYETFKDAIEKGDSKVLTYFSINPDNMELSVARRGSYTTYVDFDGSTRTEASEASYVEETVNYQKYVQNYSVPINFFIALHVISQDTQFMEDVVKMVTGAGETTEPIVLTYVDSSYVSTTQYDYNGQVISIVKDADEKDDQYFQLAGAMTEEEFEKYTEKIIIGNSNAGLYYNTSDYHKKVVTSSMGRWYVTNADTWLKSSGKDLSDCADQETSNENSELVINRPAIKAAPEGVFVETAEDTTSPKIVRRGVTLTETVKATNTSKKYTVVDKESEITVDDFVDLIRKYPIVEDNFKSAPSDIFYLLQQNENTQKLERIMRYVLLKLSGIDYGVTAADLEYLLTDSFTEYNNVGNLAAYLLIFSHGSGYEAPQSEDGQYYKMYGDGVGWPTIGNADLQWKSHHKSFSVPGKILHKGNAMEVANIADYINTNCLTRGSDATYTNDEVAAMEIYIDKAIVDEVGDKVQQGYYDYVLSQTTGLNLTRQQIYPLVAIAYNFGHLPERNNRTFKDTYLEASDKFEEYSWEHNRYVWDTWWNRIGGGAAGHIPSRDAQFETYVKGVFDYSLSEAGDPFSRSMYIYYTAQQLAQFSYAPSKTITRDPNDEAAEEEIFTTVQMSGEFTADNGPLITGYYTSTMGRTFTILNQGKIDTPVDWAMKCNRAACAIIASGYSDETPAELVQTMNDNYKGDPVIPPTKDYWHLYGLKRTEFYTNKMSVEEYTEKLRNQLKKGGYAAIWINNNESIYLGKSGEKWTELYHWVAVIDYRIHDGQEQIVIADARGADWYDIDEFILGINHLALIDED